MLRLALAEKEQDATLPPVEEYSFPLIRVLDPYLHVGIDCLPLFNISDTIWRNYSVSRYEQRVGSTEVQTLLREEYDFVVSVAASKDVNITWYIGYDVITQPLRAQEPMDCFIPMSCIPFNPLRFSCDVADALLTFKKGLFVVHFRDLLKRSSVIGRIGDQYVWFRNGSALKMGIEEVD